MIFGFLNTRTSTPTFLSSNLLIFSLFITQLMTFLPQLCYSFMSATQILLPLPPLVTLYCVLTLLVLPKLPSTSSSLSFLLMTVVRPSWSLTVTRLFLFILVTMSSQELTLRPQMTWVSLVSCSNPPGSSDIPMRHQNHYTLQS